MSQRSDNVDSVKRVAFAGRVAGRRHYVRTPAHVTLAAQVCCGACFSSASEHARRAAKAGSAFVSVLTESVAGDST
jgi:hypothetical protein